MSNSTNVLPSDDITIKQGDDYSEDWAIYDSGVPVNLTGCTFLMQARRTPSSAVAFSFALVVKTAASGIANCSLSAAVSAAIACGELPTDSASRYVFDAKMTTNAGAKRTVREGFVFVDAQISLP